MLELEVRRDPDGRKREDVLALLLHSSERAMPTPVSFDRAQKLQGIGYGAIDAWHLALAEQAGVDVLLTTDDRFLRIASRGIGKPTVELANPLDWRQRGRP